MEPGRISLRGVFLLLILALGCSQSVSATHWGAQFEPLLERWTNAPVGSPEEAIAGRELRRAITAEVGEAAVGAYRRYLDASVGSDAEADALDEALRLAARSAGVDTGRARILLEVFTVTALHDREVAIQDGERPSHDPGIGAEPRVNPSEQPVAVHVGTPSRLQPVRLEISAQPFTPGGVWAIEATLHNNGDAPIYVPEDGPLMLVNPPLNALLPTSQQQGEFVARFPASMRRINKHGRNWLVAWAHESLQWTWEMGTLDEPTIGTWTAAFGGPAAGIYPVSVIIPYASHLPATPAPSEQYQSRFEVALKASLVMMLPWAVIGGAVALAFSLLVEYRKGVRHRFVDVSVEFGLMVLVVSIVLFLSFALEGNNAIPRLNIESFEAAIASGILIQFLGHRYFESWTQKATRTAPLVV